jgi:type I restriction enzyme, S subunit
MIETPFKLTEAEVLASAAATLCLQRLAARGIKSRRLADIAEKPQYGYTASAVDTPTPIRFLRITDIKGGSVEWASVPFCQCERPASYLLQSGDLLVARSGSVGKSFLVADVPEPTVFASYMIRIRAKAGFVPDFAFWCFQSQQFWEQLLSQRRGSAMANINGQMLSALEFALPGELLQERVAEFLNSFRRRLLGHRISIGELPQPLEDIPRTVALIEELAAQIREARTLRYQAIEKGEVLIQSAIGQAFDLGERQGWPKTNFGNPKALEVIDGDRGKNYPQKADFTEDGHCLFLNTSNVRQGFFSFSRCDFISSEKDAALRKGITTRGTLGNFAHYDNSVPYPNMRINSGMVILRTQRESLLPDYLCVVLKSPAFAQQVSGALSGSAQSQLPINKLNRIFFPTPPLPEQRRIVTELDALQAEVDALKRLQAETTAELDALLPSILDKAFKGEL